MAEITPAFIAILLLLCGAILAVKKEHVVVPFIVAMCFMPADIPIMIGGLHFYPIRFLAFIGLARKYAGSVPNFKFNKLDRVFFACIILGSIVYVVASKNTADAFINRSGFFVDSAVLYIVLRVFVQSNYSIKIIMRTLCVCALILLPFAAYEYFSAKNLFAFLGREAISMRDGQVRVTCTFSHAILFGSFAAAIFPVIWAEFKIGSRQFIALLAAGGCVASVFFSSSSGPVAALAASIGLLFFFKWRHLGARLAWFVVWLSLFIHFASNNPIWHTVYARFTIRQSSTGYYRALLVDAAVKEFENWWLLGYGDVGPDWHEKYWTWAHAKFTDMTNNYLLEGVRGGFFTMMLFVMVCFIAVKSFWKSTVLAETKEEQWIWWGLTVMMLTHCISFLSVAYFGQITLLFYLTVAIAAFAFDQNKKMSISNTVDTKK